MHIYEVFQYIPFLFFIFRGPYVRRNLSISFQVRSILKSYRWAPLIPVSVDSSMLSVLLLLSKYRLRNVPVIEPDKPDIKNFITQSAVVNGLEGCKGRDWFDCIAGKPINDLGLPFMAPEEVMFNRQE